MAFDTLLYRGENWVKENLGTGIYIFKNFQYFTKLDKKLITLRDYGQKCLNHYDRCTMLCSQMLHFVVKWNDKEMQGGNSKDYYEIGISFSLGRVGD